MRIPRITAEAASKLILRFSVSDLLVHALVIELEAMQSYRELAQLMEQSGNAEVAEIFTKMSGIEAKHATIIDDQLIGFQLPELTTWEYRWRGLEAPENINRARLVERMTPYQALSLALDNEKRARKFYGYVVDDSTDERVRELAAEFAVEEEQHVAWVEEWLAEELLSHKRP